MNAGLNHLALPDLLVPPVRTAWGAGGMVTKVSVNRSFALNELPKVLRVGWLFEQPARARPIAVMTLDMWRPPRPPRRQGSTVLLWRHKPLPRLAGRP